MIATKDLEDALKILEELFHEINSLIQKIKTLQPWLRVRLQPTLKSLENALAHVSLVIAWTKSTLRRRYISELEGETSA